MIDSPQTLVERFTKLEETVATLCERLDVTAPRKRPCDMDLGGTVPRKRHCVNPTTIAISEMVASSEDDRISLFRQKLDFATQCGEEKMRAVYGPQVDESVRNIR